MRRTVFLLALLAFGCSSPTNDNDATHTPDVGADAATTDATTSRPDGAMSSPDTTTGPDSGGTTSDTGGDTAAPVDMGTNPPVGSAGCGKANPSSGPLQMTVQGATGDYIVSIPANYDPQNPYPLGFGFHGAGRTHENCQNGDCIGFQSAMEDVAILVYMKSFSDNWTQQPERDQNAQFFEQVLDQMLADYCVDDSRVFVAGTSSGATFSNILACRYGDRLLATVPVAGGLPERDNCVGTVAALVIHGVDDYHVPFTSGEEARDFYLDRNGCTQTAVPPVAELHARVVANLESHECADYQGCMPGLDVRWCEHSEGGYDGSTHGWPTFAGDEIWAFVQSLP